MTKDLDFYRNWLDSFINYERLPDKKMFTLQNMQMLTAAWGHPERTYQTVHVAGSKGKGSVSAMIAAILAERDGRVGLYQSPHVLDWRERIRTPEGFFPDEMYLQAIQEIYEHRERLEEVGRTTGSVPTWFELMTLWGMIAFRQAGVKTAVFEVGMGGRLDATNVIAPVISVITPIEREHTQYLGETLAEIAGEKAGIIKENVPVVFAPQLEEARAVLIQKATEKGSLWRDVSQDMTVQVEGWTSQRMDIYMESLYFMRSIRTSLKMLGQVQAENAMTAALAVKTAWLDFPEELIARGLARAWLPGRFEIMTEVPGFTGVPAVVLDGAHTPKSLALTLETWQQWLEMQNFKRNPGEQLLFACAADKPMSEMAQLLIGKFAGITLTIPGTFKQANLVGLEAAFAEQTSGVEVNGDFREAFERAFARANQEQQPLLVTGSFYLVGEVKQWLEDRQVD